MDWIDAHPLEKAQPAGAVVREAAARDRADGAMQLVGKAKAHNPRIINPGSKARTRVSAPARAKARPKATGKTLRRSRSKSGKRS
jgi:hypothetical protein